MTGRRVVGVVMGLGIACDSGPSSAQRDRAAYAESARLQRTDVVSAAQACDDIGAPQLRAECLGLLMRDLAAVSTDADAWCATMPDRHWVDLCRFEVIDGRALRGAEAVAACREVQTFHERCLSHALTRQVNREWRVIELGQEDDFVAWLDEQRQVYGIATSTADLAADQLARVIARRMKPERGRVGPPPDFSRAVCGAASARTCSRAFHAYVRDSTRGMDLGSVCQGSLSADELRAAGLPGWSPDAGELASEVWGQLCYRRTGQSPVVVR